ncbi:MAG: ABC transporter permease [bacterium]|nr:ABC transporter permease [bacterium]
MNKLWLIIRREYLTNVRKPSFLFTAFGTPLILISIVVLVIIISLSSETNIEELAGVGYVDQAGVITPEARSEEYPDLFSPYASEEEARAALDSGTIDAYYVIPENYLATSQVQLYSNESMPSDLEDVFDEFLVSSFLSQITAEVPSTRVLEPVEATLHIESTGRELTEAGITGIILLPLLLAVVFMIGIQLTSGLVMSGLTEEKTNRLIEVLVTTVTPMQLLAGKLIGLGLLGLTQIGAWLVLLALVAVFGPSIPFLEGVVIPLDLIIFSAIYFILGYFMVASLMAAIGVLVGSEMESRQYAGVMSIVLAIPIYLTAAFLSDANGTVPTLLSMFPFTAPMSMIMRLGFVNVPAWQLALSIGILLLTALFFLWASARIFRWGLLLYGKRFNLREIIAVLRGNPDQVSQPETRSLKKEAA